LIEEGLPGMQVRFNHSPQHKGIMLNDVPRLRFVLDIEDAYSTLIVEERTAHKELPGRKNLSHIREMFAKKGQFGYLFPGLPSRARV
jgi:hypothetical protein